MDPQSFVYPQMRVKPPHITELHGIFVANMQDATSQGHFLAIVIETGLDLKSQESFVKR